jgi:hypothetical protein
VDLRDLEVDCERIEDVISVGEIEAINELITEPENFENPEEWEEGETLTEAELGGPEFEVDRSEDYHEMGSPGVVETLVETMLPVECQKNNNILWLTAVIMAEIAQNQAFYEGNKRTAYMVGSLFLIKCQLLEKDEAIYPFLDRELTDKLSDLAVDGTGEDDSIDREDFYDYMKERLCS